MLRPPAIDLRRWLAGSGEPVTPRRRLLHGMAAATVSGLLGACAIPERSPPLAGAERLPRQVELRATPFFEQTEYHCGPAALASVLGAAGVDARPERLAQQIFVPARQGSLQVEMLAGARRAGVVAVRIEPTLGTLLQEVAAGQPVVVLQNLGLQWAPVWHYAVVVGYSLDRGELILRSGTSRRLVLQLAVFAHSWNGGGNWGFVVMRPGQWPATASAAAATDASIAFERVATPQAALRSYAAAVQRWPGELALTIGLGNSAFAAGRKVLAADSFETAARAHRSAAAWINLGRTLLDAGLIESAWRVALEAEFIDDAAWRGETTALLRDVAARRSGAVDQANPSSTRR